MKKFENYCSNLQTLLRAPQEDLSNQFIVSGIVSMFSLQFELGWKLLKELLRYEGRQEAASGSPREILKTAFAVYDFIDEAVWLAMLRERNTMSHIYDGAEARRLADRILKDYLPAFITLRNCIAERYSAQLSKL